MQQEQPFVIPRGARLFKDIYDAVLNDEWIFLVIWGAQRKGKSTLGLWCPYFFWRMFNPDLTEDELWQRVYDSCIFNLTDLIYKLLTPAELRVWDNKHLHHRVPILLWDDFAVHSNKAVTQHERAWDYFKGGFDALGTKMGVLILTMTTPEQPTSQIEHKYTHEVFITERGRYKYDKVIWQQDFRGWRSRHSKAWQQSQRFAQIPMKRYKEYDKKRMTLADEMLINIQDQMARKIPWILKRTTMDDIVLLLAIIADGVLSWGTVKKLFGEKSSRVLKRCRAHQLIIPVRRGTHYHYDITSLGFDLIQEYQRQQAKPKE